MNSTSNKQMGTSFEATTQQMAQLCGWTVVRIPDGCKDQGAGPFHKLIRVKSPFDFLAVKQGHTIFFDCKTFQENTLSYSSLNWNQVEKLLSLEREQCLAGYIVYFRSLDRIVFFKASQMFNLRPHTSLLPEQGIFLGTLTTFRFDRMVV